MRNYQQRALVISAIPYHGFKHFHRRYVDISKNAAYSKAYDQLNHTHLSIQHYIQKQSYAYKEKKKP
ncbi:hypothetical protein L1887_03475 [Cichorium endivia]|nr:hypothetical protein L1887_03475 [Cichorium endivia]